MPTNHHSPEIIEQFIEQAMQVYTKDRLAKLPEEVADRISVSPEILLDLFPLLKLESEQGADIDSIRILTLFNLILEAMCVIRYDLDRQSKSAQGLYQQFIELLVDALPTLPLPYIFQISQGLHEAKLEIPESLQLSFFESVPSENNELPDIYPKLPELLANLKRKKVVKNEFERCELLLTSIALFPVAIQALMVYELALSKKTVETAVLFLLHPQKKVRMAIAALFLERISILAFSSISLRRMIVIRNWIPADERPVLDELIKTLRLNKLNPAPYPISKINAISASAFDGAGAQVLILSSKQRSKRQLGGFLVKIDIGIRDAWVSAKASKSDHQAIIDQQPSLTYLDVSKSYLNKMVRHFIAVGLDHNRIPHYELLYLSEVMGCSYWQAQRIDEHQALADLEQQIASDLLDPSFVALSLDRSGMFHYTEEYTRNWFDQGELVNERVDKAMRLINEGGDDDKLLTQLVVKPNLEKWRQQLLLMCLWYQSNSPKHESPYKDLLVLLIQLKNQVPLEQLPFFCQLGRWTVKSVVKRMASKEFDSFEL